MKQLNKIYDEIVYNTLSFSRRHNNWISATSIADHNIKKSTSLGPKLLEQFKTIEINITLFMRSQIDKELNDNKYQ